MTPALTAHQIDATARSLGLPVQTVRDVLAEFIAPVRACRMCGQSSRDLDTLRHCRGCREEIPV